MPNGMTAVSLDPSSVSSDAAIRTWVSAVRQGLEQGRLAPYLGPGLLEGQTTVPASETALAKWLGTKVSLPRRARGNMWASAQYIESNKHRQTVDALMNQAFADSARTALPIHRYLASMPLPLIVDTWYDGGMRAALGERADWIEVQGGSRARIGEARWWRSYRADGSECDDAAADGATTLLYKPHGSVAPIGNYLVSDADYVEVLTEIDIQTPIPPAVKTRRSELGFVYLGCRFHDQTLRIFARQIGKRAVGPRFFAFEPDVHRTRTEQRFIEEADAEIIYAPTAEVVAALCE